MRDARPPVVLASTFLTVAGPVNVADSPGRTLKSENEWNRFPPICRPRAYLADGVIEVPKDGVGYKISASEGEAAALVRAAVGIATLHRLARGGRYLCMHGVACARDLRCS